MFKKNPDGVIIFNLPNPISHTISLRSTQPLTEMITTNISWRVKVACA